MGIIEMSVLNNYKMVLVSLVTLSAICHGLLFLYEMSNHAVLVSLYIAKSSFTWMLQCWPSNLDLSLLLFNGGIVYYCIEYRSYWH